jgi:hypothetical protein
VGLTWTHGACRVAGVEAWTGPANAGASAAPVVQSGKPGAAGGKPGGESGSDAVSAPSASAAAQLGRSRSPSFDADCERHYKGKPIAYQITGGAFHDREPLVSASGCTKRDVGRGWTSVCCAQ